MLDEKPERNRDISEARLARVVGKGRGKIVTISRTNSQETLSSTSSRREQPEKEALLKRPVSPTETSVSSEGIGAKPSPYRQALADERQTLKEKGVPSWVRNAWTSTKLRLKYLTEARASRKIEAINNEVREINAAAAVPLGDSDTLHLTNDRMQKIDRNLERSRAERQEKRQGVADGTRLRQELAAFVQEIAINLDMYRQVNGSSLDKEIHVEIADVKNGRAGDRSEAAARKEMAQAPRTREFPGLGR